MKKNKSFSRIPYYLSRQQIPVRYPLTLLELVTPHSIRDVSRKALLENTLQWEDDGGKISDELISTNYKYPVQPTEHDQSTP